jgi:tyrosyl-tRNA synthetase
MSSEASSSSSSSSVQDIEDEENGAVVETIDQAQALSLMRKDGELSASEKFQLVLSIAEECVQPEELRNLLEKKPNPRCYDGFEPSGRMHIAQGLFKALNVNKCTKAGMHFVFWVADWFAMLNNKMGGDLRKIKIVGEYMIEVWKACGMDMENVEFLWASEEINKSAGEYWVSVMNIARMFNVPRITRCAQIMGRQDDANMPASQIFYPCMQCADIFYLKADVCQLGLDQRKVNMLAREYCTKTKRKLKPIIVSHHMLAGLKEGQAKMSKSDPDSAIFMEDPADIVNGKIKRAFCPPAVVEGNPCLDYVRHIVFNCRGEFQVRRKPDNGGDKLYAAYAGVERDYVDGALHPGDLKTALAAAINELLEPVRQHFKSDARARKLFAQVKKFRTTR